MDYFNLNPSQKIEKYLKQRQKMLKLERLKPIGIYIFFFIIASFASYIAFNKYSLPFVVLASLLFTISVIIPKPKWYNKKTEFFYEMEHHEPLNLESREQIKQNLSNSTNVKIINTIYTGKNQKGELLFGKERNKVIFPQKPYPTKMKYFIEDGIKKNDKCFVICINSFENPVAVFTGYYNGKEYLTWDEH